MPAFGEIGGPSSWLVRLEVVDPISPQTVQRTLRNELQPHRKQCWMIPPKQNAAFVAAMEDVLELYYRPRDERVLLVCMDEQLVQPV